MVALRGHFDGKVIVPDEPVTLPVGQPLIVRVETAGAALPPRGVPGSALLRFAATIPPTDLLAMKAAIDDGCARVDPDEW